MIDKNTEQEIADIVTRVMDDKFAHVLEDISWRIEQAYSIAGRNGEGKNRVYAEDLNLQDRHFITGYTLTNNSPTAGQVAWADLHMVYNGQNYDITNGSTANMYIWWSPTTTPLALQSSNTKPTLSTGEVLLFINSGGVGKVMLSDTNTSLPSVLANGAVDSSAILANAVTSTAIADGAVVGAALGANAVTSGKIADGAVQRAAILAANVVTSTQLADNAVVTAALAANAITNTKIADGALNRAGQISGKIVGTAALAANAVTATEVANGAINRVTQITGKIVDNTIIKANAITAAEVADGAVVRAAQLGANVVTTTQIAANAVTNGAIATGAVGAPNLNILRHVMY